MIQLLHKERFKEKLQKRRINIVAGWSHNFICYIC